MIKRKIPTYIIVGKDAKVVKVSTFKWSPKFREKYRNFKVYEWGLEEKCSYKKGDVIKIAGNRPGAEIILRKDFTKKKKRLPHPNRKEEVVASELLRFLETVSMDQVLKLESVLHHIKANNEPAYRAFYNSFKMYTHHQADIKDLIDGLFELIGRPLTLEIWNDPDLLREKIIEVGFSSLLADSVYEAMKIEFTLDCNERARWNEDAIKIGAATYYTVKAMEMILAFCRSLFEGKLFFQNEGRNILTWEEAGAMEAYEVLRPLRGSPRPLMEMVSRVLEKRGLRFRSSNQG